VILSEVIPFLEEHAAPLGIQRIHDYMGKRYWQNDKGWIGRPPGNGYDWIHIETTAEAWADKRTVEQRTGTKPPPAPKAPTGKAASWQTVKLGDSGDQVRRIQTVLLKGGALNSSGRGPFVVDGQFGPVTDLRVREYQRTNGLGVDGQVGPKTAAHMKLL
jgi:hypothetical protein